VKIERRSAAGAVGRDESDEIGIFHVELIDANASGVIFAHGSRFGGHALFIKDHKLHYVYNFLGIKPEQHFVSKQNLKPGKYTLGSAGTGSGTHMNAEKFKLATGIDAVHVPYKGTPEALTDTMAGRVTYFFSPISAALPQVKEGKLVALGVSSAQRSSILKDVPTIAESGLPAFDYNLWIGLFGPAGMPPELVDRISKDVQRALGSTEIKERLASLGAEPMPMTPAEFRAFTRNDFEVSAKIVKAAGIKAQ